MMNCVCSFCGGNSDLRADFAQISHVFTPPFYVGPIFGPSEIENNDVNSFTSTAGGLVTLVLTFTI